MLPECLKVDNFFWLVTPAFLSFNFYFIKQKLMVNNVSLTLTVPQFLELAKLFNVGSFLTMCEEGYENEVMRDDVLLAICKVGYEQANEYGDFEKGGVGTRYSNDEDFLVSTKLFNECKQLLDDYDDRALPEALWLWLAERDFDRRYGKKNIQEVVQNPDWLNFLQSRQEYYRQEFLLNGSDNLYVAQ